MRVYINTPAFHVRSSTNTDWQYLRMFKELPKYSPDLEPYYQKSLFCDLRHNFQVAAGIAARRIGLRMLEPLAPGLETSLSLRDLGRSGCDVIYSYGAYPVNARSLPVVYHTGATNQELLRARGVSENVIEEEKKQKRKHGERATLITANSSSALDNLAECMPSLRSKMRLLPFFLPHLVPVTEREVNEKFRAHSLLHLLFVGRQGRLKGLPQLLEAFQIISARFPGKLHLTVVSSMSDGAIHLPHLPNLTYHKSLSRPEVQLLMRNSHVMVMPSGGDGYGWVYLEALAAGAVPIACDYPIQREILDNGRAGLLVHQTAFSICDALFPHLLQPETLRSMALHARNHCAANFIPEVVAARMSEVFAESICLTPKDGKGALR